MSNNTLTPRKQKLIFVIVYGAILGIIGEVIAATILFHRYDSFFESAVVALLVMLLCSVALLRGDLSPGGLLELPRVVKEGDSNDGIRELQAQLRAFFYGVALLHF